MTAPLTHPVLPAQSAPIDDRFLGQIRNIAYAARRGDLTQAEAELLLNTVGPLLDELILHRAMIAGLAANGANILQLPRVR